MGLQSLSSFVLTNIDLIETPDMQSLIKENLTRYNDVLISQVFLQEQGVSFSYTDTITYYDREDLIKVYQDFLEMKNQKNQELLNKYKK